MLGILLLIAVLVGITVNDALISEKVTLDIFTGSAEAVYDGTPLTNHNWHITNGTLKSGHNISVTFVAAQTNVGEVSNSVSVLITDELGADVTGDYKINYDLGTLKVTPRPITVNTKDASKIYDGKALSCKEYTLSPENKALVKGHKERIVITSLITNKGITTNAIDQINIYDENGLDVTNNYQIMANYGLLEIKPRTVTITSEDASKEYDGKPLTCDKYEVTSSEGDGFLFGHKADVHITGSLTKPGVALNTIGSVFVLDQRKNDVTENYNIITKEGILLVTSRNQGDAFEESDGDYSDGFGGGGGGDQMNDVLYSVYATTDGAMYLRMGSFGDYYGTGWAAAPAELYNDRNAIFYMTAGLIEQMGSSAREVQIKSYSSPYVMPYFISDRGGSTNVQNDSLLEEGVTALYSFKYHEFDDRLLERGADPSTFESAYREFVYQNYLYIDGGSNAYMQSIIAAQKFSKNDKDIINKVAKYIQGAAKYNLDFDPALEQSSNIAIAFLDVYKEGVCRHYATAATLLYRSLGIPARYTVGVMAETQANRWVDVTADRGHAWVEVYIDGIGWINVEVTGSLENGEGILSPGAGGGMCDGSCEGECDGSCSGGGGGGAGAGGNETYDKKEMSLYPETVRKKYDGKPLYAEPILHGFDEYAKLGYSYYVEVTGERTELGVTQSKITAITIYDSNGNDVTSSFTLNLKPGKVHVYNTKLTFESVTYTKEYDGKITETPYKWNGSLMPDHRYSIKFTTNVNAGTWQNSFNVTILDASGSDVSDYYYIEKKYGQAIINPVFITVKAGDATKVYDGSPLICNEYSIIEGYLVDGDKIGYCLVQGTQTEIGRSDNRIAYLTIINQNEEVVTSNYTVVTKSGKLKVTAP